MSLYSDFDSLYGNSSQRNTTLTKGSSIDMATYSNELSLTEMSEAIILNFKTILKDYVFVDRNAADSPFYFISPSTNWADFATQNDDGPTLFVSEKNTPIVYQRLQDIKSKINSDFSQKNIDNELSILVIQYWNQTFGYGTYLNTEGFYQSTSRENNSIRFYSKEKSKPYIDAQPKDGIIALHPYDWTARKDLL